jgi:hypothetical protein
MTTRLIRRETIILYAAFVLGQLVTTRSIEGQLQTHITRFRDRVTLEPILTATIKE